MFQSIFQMVFQRYNNPMDESLYQEIEKEYIKVDKRWLSYFFKIMVVITILNIVIECSLGSYIYKTGYVSTTLNLFILKYTVIPSATCIFVTIIAYMVLYSKHFLLVTKIYTITLLSVIIFFVIYTVHGSFNSLYFIFAAPILLSAIYVRYKLTIITSVISLSSFIFSELFIHWDPDKVDVLANGQNISNFIIAIFIILSFIGISLIIIYFEKEKNLAGIYKEIEHYQLKKKLEIDELTQVYNRIALRKSINSMYNDETDTLYTFVMMDIDNFKLLNDEYGHVEGDKCLIDMCNIMKDNSDGMQIFRYGGDEFCILFQNYSKDEIVKMCKSIQKDFIPISKRYVTKNMVSLSFGIADYIKGTSPTKLIEDSDLALYQSKKVKNKITIYKDS